MDRNLEIITDIPAQGTGYLDGDGDPQLLMPLGELSRDLHHALFCGETIYKVMYVGKHIFMHGNVYKS